MQIFGLWRKTRQPEPDPPQDPGLVTYPSLPQPHTDTDSSPSETLPVPLFPNGVKVLHDCPDATIDICFVHGLTGDRESTWTADGQSTPWPKTLLPPRLQKARILTYGYDAYVVRASAASANRLNDHARNLLVKLTTNRDLNRASSRALIFVAHSLGGLVCKEAILLSRNNPEPHLCGIFDCTKGVIFMGTPHKGAWMANWARIPVSTLGLFKSVNKSLLEVLDTKNEYLGTIQSKFMEMLRQRQQQGEGSRPIGIACFLEELPLTVAGMVVPKESAILDGFTYATIHGNHRNMVKFATAEEDGFQLLLGELVRWESQASQILSETAQGCLKSLAFPHMQSRSYDIDRAVTGTCEWLHRHEAYRGWAASDRGLLWIKGKPGSGKSTLVKHALETLGARGDAVILSFFFHGRGDELQRIPLGLFRSLLHQALSQAPDALQDLVDVFETKNKHHGSLGKDWHWHEAELQPFLESFLREVVLKRRSVWLFIDALDESGKDDAVRLVEVFQSLLQRLPSQSTAPGQVHICFSCRHYPVLDVGEGRFEICAEDENQRDIAAFVDDQLVAFRAQSSTLPTLITERASGVFMWARLVVKQVLDLDREGVGPKKIHAAVYSIPPGLDTLYWQLIQGMGPTSLKLIQWICFATQPLTLDDLRWAMVIEGDCPHRSLKACRGDEDYVSNKVRMKRQVQTLSRGLAEVIETGHIQFIHQSVNDFILEKGLPALDGSKTATEAALRAHFRLAKICIRYLAMEEVHSLVLSTRRTFNQPSASKAPFLHYAARSWVAHVRQCDDRSIPHEELLTLFAWPSVVVTEYNWLHVDEYAPICPCDEDPYVSSGTSLVHIASRYGLFRLLTASLERALSRATYIDATEEEGQTPLWWAASEGHEAVVALLLGTGEVDVNAECHRGSTPLLNAASAGHKAVVELLLGTGKVNAETEDEEGWTPLSSAASAGHKAVVELLLGTGKVDADMKSSECRTPLSWAAGRGREAIAKLLLGTGEVDADTKDWADRTPLWHAAGWGHEAVVELLLDTNKVDVETRDTSDQETPLLRAAGGGHEAVVKLLLHKGKADVEGRHGASGQTPLSYAARRGHVAVLELLLRTGRVDPESKDNNGRTPLSWAAERGQETVVKILLGIRKVDADSKDIYGRTPLSWAAREGQEAVVKLLLATGKVDIEAEDSIFHRTPRMWALYMLRERSWNWEKPYGNILELLQPPRPPYY